ncbi:NAD(P)-dependent oxidoreductase, partial [Paenibacillus larvae]
REYSRLKDKKYPTSKQEMFGNGKSGMTLFSRLLKQKKPSPSKYHMIGHEQIEAMKQGAFLINTARGGLVDTGALIKALENGRLGGAALDVLEGEEGLFYFDCTQKPIDNQFLLKLHKMPNVIITPHTAYYTGRALYDTVEKTILNCLHFERRDTLE